MTGFHPRHRGSLLRETAVLAGALGFLFSLAASTMAQDGAAEGAKIWANKAGCPFCHGWAGDGQGDAHSEGNAPALRTTELDRNGIREVIQCGRPATAMPHYDKFAYSDKRCYGQTAADLGNDVPNDPPTGLQRYEIDAVADYVATKLKGAGPVTKEECVAFFGGGAEACNKYPTRQAQR